LDLKLSSGINVFIGANATGKTHLMKIAYAACDISKTKDNFAAKLIRVFMPSGRAIGRLVKRQKGGGTGTVEVHRGKIKISATFANRATTPDAKIVKITGVDAWNLNPIESVYIPVKEMLSNAPGFRSLYSQREVHFEEVYADILDRAYLPAKRGPIDATRKRLLSILQKTIEGRVSIEKEEFFLSNRQGNLEFSLLAEGLRKLGLLWLLIQNGALSGGSVLFWDEPETNLNPKIIGSLMEIILDLQRMGVQIFLATHDYGILKALDLRKKSGDNIAFHSLFRTDDGEIEHNTASSYIDIQPNDIAEAFASLYDMEIKRSLGGVS